MSSDVVDGRGDLSVGKFILVAEKHEVYNMIAPQDYDVRQSGRVLGLQDRDLWIRPIDLSWHFPVLVTIRELPFKKYRGRSLAKLEAREEKIEEAKKQKTLKNRDEDRNSPKLKHSLAWNTSSSSSSSAWRDWSSTQTRERSDWHSPAHWSSSDETRERTDWQPADWDSSDLTRQATALRS